MSRQCFRVTIYLAEGSKGPAHSYRMWCSLMALDTVIMDEFFSAGTILADSFESDKAVFEAVPGVAAVRVELKPEPVYDPDKDRTLERDGGHAQEHREGRRKPRGREVARA